MCHVSYVSYVLHVIWTQAVSCQTRAADLSLDQDQDRTVLCPPDCPQRVSVFGTKVYASVSSVCGAAIHSGVVGLSGGPVVVKKLPGRQNYLKSYSNGVQSQHLPRWTSSFSLARTSEPLELSSQSSTTALAAEEPALTLVSSLSDCQLDVVVVLDGSENIGRRRFNLQKNFVVRLASFLKVGPSGPHLAMVQASGAPKTEFLLNNFTQPKDLLYAIKEVSYNGGDTNTGRAILHAVESLFSPERGGRRGHPRAVLVLVDGWPSDDLDQASVLARESGINVFLVSVAKPSADELPMVPDKDFTRKAVCKDNGHFSFSIPNWFSANKHVKTLTQRLCSLDNLICSKTCYNFINLGFLIDGSSSVGDSNFRIVLDFLAELTQHFDIFDAGSRVGAVQFTYDQRLEFGLHDHMDKEQVLTALKDIYYMSGGTATGAAIEFAMHHLFSRRSTRGRDFLVVITDGQSYDDVRAPALVAQRQGVTMLAVGVAWAPMEDLRDMASEPKDAHTFFSREFTGLYEFIPKIIKAICRQFNEHN
uniref:Cochlin n=1 Tax=Periophthalmus magnuspinnatus TaxID=409849 RepID=A0A3B4AIZ0_9GOBI